MYTEYRLITDKKPSPPTFGGALGGLFNNTNKLVQSTINSTERVALNFLLTTAQQVELTIEGVRNAYRDYENKPVNRISKEATAALIQVEEMVKELENKTEQALGALSGRALLFLQGLPFIPRQPKVLNIGPKNFIVSAGAVNYVYVVGVFSSTSLGEKYIPKLNIGGADCPLVDNDDRQLVFEISAEIIEKKDPHKYVHLPSAMLTVPWDNSGWIFGGMETAIYRIALNVLPDFPAKIEVFTTASVPRYLTTGILTSTEQQLWGLNDVPRLTVTVFPKNPGFKIDTTVTPIVITTESLNGGFAYIQSITPTAITYIMQVNCHQHTGGDNGFWRGHLLYQEVKEYKENEPRSIIYSDMTWNESRIIEMTPNETLKTVKIDNYLNQLIDTGANPHLEGPVQLELLPLEKQWRLHIVPPTN